jgi:hypothetical protein
MSRRSFRKSFSIRIGVDFLEHGMSLSSTNRAWFSYFQRSLRRKQQSTRLTLESLEDRMVPSASGASTNDGCVSSIAATCAPPRTAQRARIVSIVQRV